MICEGRETGQYGNAMGLVFGMAMAFGFAAFSIDIEEL